MGNTCAGSYIIAMQNVHIDDAIVTRVRGPSGRWVEVLPVSYVAGLLDVTVQTIRNRIRDGTLDGWQLSDAREHWVVTVAGVRRAIKNPPEKWHVKV